MVPGVDYVGVGCGALIMNDKNETLLQKRGKNSRNQVGYWSKPGGKVEFSETVEDAIRREIKEELGIDIELIRSLGFMDHVMKEEGQHWLSINYLAKIVRGEPKNMEPDKHDEVRWFSLDNLPENLTQTTSEAIEEYLKFLRRV